MSNKLDIFQDDNKIRTVIAYGKIHRGLTESPVISVHVKNLDNEQREVYPVLLTDLSKVRIGSKFQGQKELENYDSNHGNYRYEENIEFNFDFNEDDPENVIFVKNEDEWSDEAEYPYDHNTVNKLKPQNGTVFAKLTNKNGTAVYISSLELLVSGYYPKAKNLIRLLVNLPLNVAIEYIGDLYKIYQEYFFFYRIKKENFPGTKSCVNHLTYHPISRARASIIWTSIELTRKDNTGSHIAVLPYHPEKMTIRASGFWIDEKRFSVQRIDKVFPPSGYKTVLFKPVYEADNSVHIESVYISEDELLRLFEIDRDEDD